MTHYCDITWSHPVTPVVTIRSRLITWPCPVTTPSPYASVAEVRFGPVWDLFGWTGNQTAGLVQDKCWTWTWTAGLVWFQTQFEPELLPYMVEVQHIFDIFWTGNRTAGSVQGKCWTWTWTASLVPIQTGFFAVWNRTLATLPYAPQHIPWLAVILICCAAFLWCTVTNMSSCLCA